LTENPKKKMRCIVCPEGCPMHAEYEAASKKIISLEGYKCKRGIKFAEDEITNPLRLLTTTISIDSKIAQAIFLHQKIKSPL
jgi:CxxC motif-containing protein